MQPIIDSKMWLLGCRIWPWMTTTEAAESICSAAGQDSDKWDSAWDGRHCMQLAMDRGDWQSLAIRAASVGSSIEELMDSLSAISMSDAQKAACEQSFLATVKEITLRNS